MATDTTETPKAATASAVHGGQAERGAAWRLVISLLLGSVALGIGGGIFTMLASLKTAPPRREIAERSYNVTTFVVEPLSVVEIVSGFGTAEPDKQVMISAEVAGLVVDTHPNLEVGFAPEAPTGVGGSEGNSGLKRGDILLKIDPATYKQRIEGLEQKINQLIVQRDQLAIEEENEQRLLEKQQESLATAESELQSKRKTKAAGAGSATAVRNAELQVRQYEEQIVRLKNVLGLFVSRRAGLQAQIEASNAELESSRLDLIRTEVIPPFPGILSDVRVEQGQYVRPGDPLVELTDVDHVDVPVALTQSQFARIAPLLDAGEQPSAKLAENETDPPRWEGRVVRAAPVADEVTRTVNVYIEVDNTKQSSKLLPGTFVHARIQAARLEDLIVIPRDVVLGSNVYVASTESVPKPAEPTAPPSSEPEGEQESETDRAPERPATRTVARTRKIAVERSVQSFVVVTEGLSSGDRIVMTNLDVVHDGALITPQAEQTVRDELTRQRVPVLEIVDGTGNTR